MHENGKGGEVCPFRSVEKPSGGQMGEERLAERRGEEAKRRTGEGVIGRRGRGARRATKLGNLKMKE